jgi:redox-sensing transcriptional repressor
MFFITRVSAPEDRGLTMSEQARASQTAMLRMSRYHCFLGEVAGARQLGRITSREIAAELGLSEETVRHDLKYVDIEGRPGAGYDLEELLAALTEYLDLSAGHPFIAIGNADMLRGLAVTFPASSFALRLVAYFSERPQDVGETVGDLVIQPLSSVADSDAREGATLALLACAPDAVQSALDVLHAAEVDSVLMLTPVLRPKHPDGMNVTYFRMPCALKTLAASACSSGAPCCG